MANPEILTSHPVCDPKKVYKELSVLKGLKLIQSEIDVQGFQNYMKNASYPSKYRNAYKELFFEKALEHYASIELLGYDQSDVSVDIAASSSPFSEIVESLFNSTSFCQDIIFPPGVNGRKVGGSATKLPFADGSITRMTLHCSIEHFEKDQDTEFIIEATRKLAIGGKICIIPLYLREVFYNNTDPTIDISDVEFDQGAKILHSPGWNNRFGRNYDVTEFNRRILRVCNDLDTSIYFFENSKDVHHRCYLTFAFVLEKMAN